MKSRTSTDIAVAFPPASVISRATVLIVDDGEFGSGGKGEHFVASDVVFAATTTVGQFYQHVLKDEHTKVEIISPAYPAFARSIATCLPMPRDDPTTSATSP